MAIELGLGLEGHGYKTRIGARAIELGLGLGLEGHGYRTRIRARARGPWL